ncbi:hypothetical protein V9T40_008771 [Parthenolecanium corni]|uniref:Uncharacterized protein n=1 Tax=Parthenolecanium corni TaxID=536013 RepID=A0AAN9TRB5_9HEMI
MVSCLWRGAANPIKISRSHIKRTSSKFTVNPHALPNLSITPLFDFDFHLCPAPPQPCLVVFVALSPLWILLGYLNCVIN